MTANCKKSRSVLHNKTLCLLLQPNLWLRKASFSWLPRWNGSTDQTNCRFAVDWFITDSTAGDISSHHMGFQVIFKQMLTAKNWNVSPITLQRSNELIKEEFSYGMSLPAIFIVVNFKMFHHHRQNIKHQSVSKFRLRFATSLSFYCIKI